MKINTILPLLGIVVLVGWGCAFAEGYKYRLVSPGEDPTAEASVFGFMRTHAVTATDTLLDIARNYGLGFNEIHILYPDMDPWIPEAGRRLSIPTQWVLPSSKHHGVVINLPELRLYRFFPRIGMVKTYPVGIGNIGWETPEGIYRVIGRQVYPTWTIPLSLREKYGKSRIPPGPENPLGKYWIGLSRKGYGIHGTNFPWGVGRLISHGCIRLYPEHIAQLYEEVSVGTPVEIIYEPVKIGLRHQEIFLEVHPDPYTKITDMAAHTRNRLQILGLWDFISVKAVKEALQKQNGVPVRVGSRKKGWEKDTSQRAENLLRLKDSIDGPDKEVIR